MSWYDPWCELKADIFLSLSSMLMCQYPQFSFNAEKMVASPRDSIHSSMREIGYQSRLVIAFS